MERLDYHDIQAFDVRVQFRRVPLHIHNAHEFFYCYAGAGEQLVKDGVEPMRPGELFFFPAGDPHRGSGRPDQDCIGAVVNFGDDLLYGLPRDGDDLLLARQLLQRWTVEKHHRVPLTPDGSRAVGELSRAMVGENRDRRTGYRGALLIMAQQLLLTILRDSTFPADWLAQSRRDAGEKIEYACLYLERNCTRQVSVTEVCRAVGMSRSRFHAAFLRRTGATMTEYLNRLRCRQAVRMLREGTLPTAEIARYCGFGSIASFYRAVRREAGVKPNELRNEE